MLPRTCRKWTSALGTLALLLTGSASAASRTLYDPATVYDEGTLEGVCRYELCLIRNEMFALHGHGFVTPWIAEYFEAQDWYAPAASAGEESLSFDEWQDVELLRELELRLGESMFECWLPRAPAPVECGYFAFLESQIPPDVVIPEAFTRFSTGGVEIWSRPVFPEEGALPVVLFDPLTRNRAELPASIDDETREANVEAVERLLGGYGVDEPVVYRVLTRGDGTIAAVEKYGLLSGDYRGCLEAKVLWRAVFDTEENLSLFYWSSVGGGWTSNVAIICFSSSADGTGPRAVISGSIEGIDLHVLAGPYGSLPFTANLYDLSRDGEERYGALTALPDPLECGSPFEEQCR